MASILFLSPRRLTALFVLLVSAPVLAQLPGTTMIDRWPDGKRGAVSITFDDGIITQFTVARPILDSLGLDATFYVITGKIPGSGQGKFIGRPPADIIAETARTATNADNFFERASLIAFTGTTEAVDYHSRAGAAYEAGRIAAAYQLMDEAYRKLRAGELRDTDAVVFHDNPVDTTTWEDLRTYQAAGHEIASHTVTHPRLAVLDSVNMHYELEQSRADIARELGPAATFTAEGPYGTEDERVMKYAHRIYPALRNRMPEPYLAELNRGSREQPGSQDREYVQWQRGPVDGTTLQEMKDWVDTTLAHDNVWLVEVFHGVDDYGWAARPGEELRKYFTYLKEREDRLWIAPFATVTKYIRERQGSRVTSSLEGNRITVALTSPLAPATYDVPLTLTTLLPEGWTKVHLLQPGGSRVTTELPVHTDARGRAYVRYSLPPGGRGILRGN
ncbi:peptidoglycan/xylan/chitin deacetylase (PgdA/CDA1 family) [Lewinella marina]|uniref:Polysaccharide deacetylase n=1 Tax=Neolewinella marina TaxID=438751 RepID=A0A2G0CKA4_9BACT|nr:polysaccharide deacetylase family protein [Neolewinella marina]NJB84402.1 peptidoglycan/xylan/chitin deacetylase (PgdA/CDA1 family) [Neolewinella marina]PHL00403.1 polysaccharide deacetylase [Neolewinella marina]